MSRLVRLTDGFIDEKFYESPDGERVTIARFTDLASEQAWAANPEHLAAQRRGRDDFYSWYDIVVAEELYSHTYAEKDPDATASPEGSHSTRQAG
jgi:heme-degrading monooxygenase HmoA